VHLRRLREITALTRRLEFPSRQEVIIPTVNLARAREPRHLRRRERARRQLDDERARARPGESA